MRVLSRHHQEQGRPGLQVSATAPPALHALADAGERRIGRQLEACKRMIPRVAAFGTNDPKLLAMASQVAKRHGPCHEPSITDPRR